MPRKVSTSNNAESPTYALYTSKTTTEEKTCIDFSGFFVHTEQQV